MTHIDNIFKPIGAVFSRGAAHLTANRRSIFHETMQELTVGDDRICVLEGQFNKQFRGASFWGS
jgi:hypothetical protein